MECRHAHVLSAVLIKIRRMKTNHTPHTRRLVERVCTDLVWASWLDTLSIKGKLEIESAVRKLENHFGVRAFKAASAASGSHQTDGRVPRQEEKKRPA
jgi:hypothetical protein